MTVSTYVKEGTGGEQNDAQYCTHKCFGNIDENENMMMKKLR